MVTVLGDRGGWTGTKHFMDAIHYIRHMIDYDYVRVRYVSTRHQLADGFTKPLEKTAFRSWCSRLMCGVGEEYS